MSNPNIEAEAAWASLVLSTGGPVPVIDVLPESLVELMHKCFVVGFHTGARYGFDEAAEAVTRIIDEVNT